MATLSSRVIWNLVILIVIVVIILIIIRNVKGIIRQTSGDEFDRSRPFANAANNTRDFYAHAFKDGSSNVIYIRHGHDESSGYHHDQRLTEQGWKEAQNLARHLIQQHGPPAAIYYSPFDRTTDTAKAMYKVVRDELNISDLKIRIEPRLGKYFTSDQRAKPSVSHATIERGMIVHPSKTAFQSGLNKHHVEVKRKFPGKVVWNVTHAIGVNHHVKRIHGKGESIDYLQHVVALPSGGV